KARRFKARGSRHGRPSLPDSTRIAPSDPMTSHVFTVPAEAEGERLDRYLAGEVPQYSRSRIQRLIDEGRVRVPRVKVTKANVQLREGDVIEVSLPDAAPAAPA